MRRQIGTGVRHALFPGIARAIPGFAASKAGAIPGHYWVFRKVLCEPLVCYLGYQQHWYEDWFTLEVAWSRDGSPPGYCAVASPVVEKDKLNGRFRVGKLWEPVQDIWWKVAPAVHSPGSHVDLQTYVDEQRMPLDVVLARVEPEVNDALARLSKFVGPWVAALPGFLK